MNLRSGRPGFPGFYANCRALLRVFTDINGRHMEMFGYSHMWEDAQYHGTRPILTVL